MIYGTIKKKLKRSNTLNSIHSPFKHCQQTKRMEVDTVMPPPPVPPPLNKDKSVSNVSLASRKSDEMEVAGILGSLSSLAPDARGSQTSLNSTAGGNLVRVSSALSVVSAAGQSGLPASQILQKVS